MAKPRRKQELIMAEDFKSPMSEAYRTLRTNLGFAWTDKEYRSILVSSPNPQDGKSTTIANLAVAMAQTGKRTLLVDCDLRKPVQHHIFDLPNTVGVTSCLMQTSTREESCHSGAVDNLYILPSGPIPPNPAEMLSSQRALNFWQELKNEYDYIFYDAPPVLAVADAALLAAQLDAVLLVVRSAVTRKDIAREAKEQLLKANANIIGVVLNDYKMNKQDYKYYYYYSHDS